MKCKECGKELTNEEDAYGHDCEVGTTKLKKYKVVFAINYFVEAEDSNDALDKATDEFCKDTELRSGEIDMFGSNVEEA